MLLSVSRDTEKFTPLVGLRSLLVPDTGGGGGGGGVVTRTTIIALSTSGGEDVGESGGEGEGGNGDPQEEDEAGCWVSCGRRDPRRGLPPPIPSLAARSTLRRTRTEDRRLVITKAPVMRPDYYVRARRRGGRLTMQLVEREDDYSDPLPPPALADPLPAPDARGDNAVAQQVGTNTTTTTAVEDEDHVPGVHTAAAPAPVPSALPPAVGCFEDAVKYPYSIGSNPLHQMHVLRMVH